jgi:methionyl-tRNA formyltransferase
MRNVVAAQHQRYSGMCTRLSSRTGQEFLFISNEHDLTGDKLRQVAPQYVFVPHWSSRIPAEVFENFETVIFHMTDVPFGRGGTPLQNLIARGIYETQVSALRCESAMDAGPVYLQRPLCLHGSAEEIYLRAGGVIEDMIVDILQARPEPVAQAGEVTVFRRRRPDESNLCKAADLQQVFDYIRMLDADSYPHAFIETDKFRFEFSRASRKAGCVLADVRITIKKNG